MAKIGIVVFPGSNCERDAFHVVNEVLGASVTYHWHDEPLKKEYRAVILPGGFSYGDYLRAGAMAKLSPAVEGLPEFADRGGFVLGICNGFQVLVESQMLPGGMTKNRSLKFQCEDVYLRVDSNHSPFLSQTKAKQVLRMPIAHADGRYVVDDETLRRMESKGQIALRYVSPEGKEDDRFNANGSVSSVAGVTNEKGNVFGLMPHPERCSEEILGNRDGLTVFQSLVAHI